MFIRTRKSVTNKAILQNLRLKNLTKGQKVKRIMHFKIELINLIDF